LPEGHSKSNQKTEQKGDRPIAFSTSLISVEQKLQRLPSKKVCKKTFSQTDGVWDLGCQNADMMMFLVPNDQVQRLPLEFFGAGFTMQQLVFEYIYNFFNESLFPNRRKM